MTFSFLRVGSAEWIYALWFIDWEKESVKAVARAAEERQRDSSSETDGEGSVYDA